MDFIRGQAYPGINPPHRFPDEKAVPARRFGCLGEVGGGAGIAAWQNETVFHDDLRIPEAIMTISGICASA
jgi:hypothetical protein